MGLDSGREKPMSSDPLPSRPRWRRQERRAGASPPVGRDTADAKRRRRRRSPRRRPVRARCRRLAGARVPTDPLGMEILLPFSHGSILHPLPI